VSPRVRYRLTTYDGRLPAHPRPEVEGDLEFVGHRCTLSFRGTRAGVSASLRSVTFSTEATGPNSCAVEIKSVTDPDVCASFLLPTTSAEVFRRDLQGRLDELAQARARRASVEAGSWWLDDAFFARFGRAATLSVSGVRYLGGWTVPNRFGSRATKVLDLSSRGIELRRFRHCFTIPWDQVKALDVPAEAIPGGGAALVVRWSPGPGTSDVGRAAFETTELAPDELRARLAPVNERISQASRGPAAAG
jgi:hypothetical protein